MGQAKQRKAEIDQLKATPKVAGSAGMVGIAFIANDKLMLSVFVPKSFFKPTSPDFERKAAELLAGAPYFFGNGNAKATVETYSIACAVFLSSVKQPASGHYSIQVSSEGPGKLAAIKYAPVSADEFALLA